MPSAPDVVLHHSVRKTQWLTAETIREEIRGRVPDLEIAVARTPAETRSLAAETPILVTSYLEADLIADASELEWVQAPSAGVDAIDVEALADAGILLTSAAGAHAQPVAEQVLGYMIAFERGLIDAHEMKERGIWERFICGELGGKTLGIVGLGEIGSRVASFADALGMDVIATKRDPRVEVEHVRELFGPDDLSAVLVDAEYVLVSCPLTEETRGLIGETELGAMKDDAVLLNVARGPIVDEDALATALQHRAIRGAGLDVFEREPLDPDSPLWDLSNVIITPHNAGGSTEVPGRIADIFAENYEAFSRGSTGEMRNRIH